MRKKCRARLFCQTRIIASGLEVKEKKSFLKDQSNKMLQGRQTGRGLEVQFIFSAWSRIKLQGLRE